MLKESVIVWVYDRTLRKRRKISISMPSTKRDRMKTSRACFANFIQQKDASIAHFLIGMYQKMNLFTVHDNFIVNPTQANHVTHCYTYAFRSLGDPLSHVNLFLIKNILPLFNCV